MYYPIRCYLDACVKNLLEKKIARLLKRHDVVEATNVAETFLADVIFLLFRSRFYYLYKGKQLY